MRKISRATISNNPNIQVVFVDHLEQQMVALKALRKKVADAERRAALQVHQPLDLQRRLEIAFPYTPVTLGSSAPIGRGAGTQNSGGPAALAAPTRRDDSA